MTYSVSQQFYFREVRRSIPAGGSVYLDDDVAKRYMETHPGLLKPQRMTAQDKPEAVRSDEASGEEPRKPRGRKAK